MFPGSYLCMSECMHLHKNKYGEFSKIQKSQQMTY